MQVADRELTSLSRSVITFTAKLHTGDHILGLGDPIVVSYRDLGIKSIVMRVTRILYGDGTTGGISVDLVQDVFADLSLFGDVVEVEPYLTVDEAPPFVRLDAEVDFLEQGYFDLTEATPFSNPHNRWLKAGVRYNSDLLDEAYVTIESVVINPSIGKLLTDIPSLVGDPRTQAIWIQVQIDPAPSPNEFVRIGDEIFETGAVRKISDDTYEVLLTKRAQRDTIATAHTIGHNADVWFLDRLWVDSEVWDGSLVHALFQSGVHGDTELLDPDVDFISRGNRPIPPAYVSVNRAFGFSHVVDGAFVVRYLPRQETSRDQTVTIRLLHNDQEIFKQLNATTPDAITGDLEEISVRISLAVLNAGVPSGTGMLTLEVFSTEANLDSWQKWSISIDWSAVARYKCGWDSDWDKNWGGMLCGGFGYDYGEDYG